jgi:hypothetical protein
MASPDAPGYCHGRPYEGEKAEDRDGEENLHWPTEEYQGAWLRAANSNAFAGLAGNLSK